MFAVQEDISTPAKRRQSSLSVQSRATRFLSRHMTAKKLNNLFLKLSPGEQLRMLEIFMSYTLSKPVAGEMSEQDIIRLHEMLTEAQKSKYAI